MSLKANATAEVARLYRSSSTDISRFDEEMIQRCKAEDRKRGNEFAALKNACDFGILSRIDADSRLQMALGLQP